MKRVTTAAGILLLVIGCGNPQTEMETEITVPVSVEEVTPKSIEEFVSVTGTVNAIKDYMVTSETGGYYRRATNPSTGKPFMIGDNIKHDQVIIYIDNPEQENSIRIESQELNLDISKSEFEKQQSLYEKGGVTLRELKNAERTFIEAKYSYENALIQLSKLKITAPFDGVIVNIPVYTDGVRLSSNSEMVHVMDYGTLSMEVNISGKQLGRITVGQPVRVVNYTLPDRSLNGGITQVSPTLDTETRTFKATIEINNQELVLRPGMFVKADIIVARRDSTIVVPKNILLTRRNRKTVYVVERGFARERRIEQGLENPDEIEVVEGLESGERLVVDGFDTLRNGSRVKIVQ